MYRKEADVVDLMRIASERIAKRMLDGVSTSGSDGSTSTHANGE
jgi:hypothetical protein